MPSLLRFFGRDPITSPSPPVPAYGKASLATNRTPFLRGASVAASLFFSGAATSVFKTLVSVLVAVFFVTDFFAVADFAAEAVLVAFFSGAAVPAVFFVGIFITP